MTDSTERVTAALEALAEDPEGLNGAALAERLGISRPTSSRLLKSLVRHGLVERDPKTQRHTLGLGLWSIAVSALTRVRALQEVSLGPMARTARRHDLSLTLALNQGPYTYYVITVELIDDAVLAREHGSREPAHTMASGRIQLAFSPVDVVERAIECGLSWPAPFNLSSREAFLEDLAQLSRRGYATFLGQYPSRQSFTHRGLAVPVLDYRGSAVAAISAGCSIDEWGQGFEERTAPIMLALGGEVSRLLGATESRRVAT